MEYATPEAFAVDHAATSLADSSGNLISKIYKTVNTWRHRSKTRALLSGVSAHTLRDIGISKTDAMIESNKPFWEA